MQTKNGKKQFAQRKPIFALTITTLLYVVAFTWNYINYLNYAEKISQGGQVVVDGVPVDLETIPPHFIGYGCTLQLLSGGVALASLWVCIGFFLGKSLYNTNNILQVYNKKITSQSAQRVTAYITLISLSYLENKRCNAESSFHLPLSLSWTS